MMKPVPDAAIPRPGQRRGWMLFGVFLLWLVFFVLFFARYYDGDALKYCVWDGRGYRWGTVNHLLTQFWFESWWRMVSWLADDEFTNRVAWLAAFNHVAGAACLTLVVEIAYVRTKSWSASLLTGLLLGVTGAFFYHAVQTTEPMVALLWFLIAWRLLATEGTIAGWRVVAAAVAYALSVGSYQSFFLGGFGLLILAWTGYRNGLLWMVVSFLAGAAIFATAAVADGATDTGEVVRYLTQKPDGAYWGFFEVKSFPGLVIGLCHAVWPLFGEDWPGLVRGFTLLPPLHVLRFFGQVLLVVILVAMGLFYVVRQPLNRFTCAALAVFLCGLFAPFYLDRYYYKLWLLPLAALVLVLAQLLVGSPVASRFALVVATLVFAYNMPRVYYKYHRADNPQAATLINLERCLTGKDLLVCDGWDVSVVYTAKYPSRPVYRLIFESPEVGGLQERIAEVRRQKGRVFFLGLLEMTPARWALTELPRRGRMSYSALDAWREQAKLVWRGSAFGGTEDLYVLP